MSEYKKYTNEDIEKAKSVDTLDFLIKKGYSFRQAGNEYKGIEHDSLVVNKDRHRWYWNSRSVGGYSVIDFCVKVEGKTFREALEEILDYSLKYTNTTNTTYITRFSYEQNQAKNGYQTIINCPELFEQQKLLLSKLPKSENGKFKRLYAYLCKKRGICPELLHELITTKRIYQDFRGNIIFLGYDRYSKKPQYAAIRCTSDNKFRGDIEGSNKEVSFFIGNYNSKTLCVFEFPIDAMSFATLLFKTDPQKSWKNIGLLSLGGTSIVALDHFIQSHPDVKRIVSAMDNDEAGLKSSEKIQEVYGKSHSVKFLNFSGKDVNEALTKFPSSPVTQSDDLLHVVKHISEINRSKASSHEVTSDNMLTAFQNFQAKPEVSFNPNEYQTNTMTSQYTAAPKMRR